jgi:hypothetical protein
LSDERVDRLAEEFLGRLRRGEAASVAEYVDRNPDLADEIRELFPALLLMEEAARPSSADRAAEPRQDVLELADARVTRDFTPAERHRFA